MTGSSLCPTCRRPVTPGDAVCFHCRAVLDPFTKGARIADRYVIEESIGQGGMGRVYRAYDEALHEKVAIKTLLAEFSKDPGFLARFRDEVRLARRVAHPNVCRVHDYVDHEGTPFLSMEWVEGETLAERLRRLGPRPETELRVVQDDVTGALRALWSNGIVHRDLKPANLMWTGSGRVKVMDLGLARALLGAFGRDRTSGVVGSPEYLSPEQIRGEAATEKSDTYALGVSLFELATSRPPFRGASPAETLLKHLSDPPDAAGLALLSEELRFWILRSLEKNPALRPDLRSQEDDRGGADIKTTKGDEAGAPKRGTTWAVSLAVIGCAIAATLYLVGRSPSVPSPSNSLSDTGRSASPAATSLPPTPSMTPRLPAPAPIGIETTDPRRPDRKQTEKASAGFPTPSLSPSLTPTPTPAITPELPSAPPIESSTPPPSPSVTVPPAKPAPTIAARLDARLRVVVIPWAEVFVDGIRRGETPFSALALPPGSHVVELRHPDYRPFRRTIELKAGEESLLSVDLRAEGVRR